MWFAPDAMTGLNREVANFAKRLHLHGLPPGDFFGGTVPKVRSRG
jgi:hypothetical protein